MPGRDPFPLERVAGPQRYSFSAGVDKTIVLVSVREDLFFTYVPIKARQLLPFHETQQPKRVVRGGHQATRQRAERYNAAVDKHQQGTPCVFDTHICAVLLWLVVFLGP